MKKYLIISSFFCAHLFAQNHRIDSLTALLNIITEDTNQVITYNKLGFELIWVGEFDKAIPYINNGLELSKKIGFKKGMANSFNGLGVIYRNKGEHKKALQNYFSSLQLAIEMESKSMMGSLYSNIGRVYANLGDYPKSIEYFYKSLRIMQLINDKSKTANVLRGIGQIFMLQNDYRAKICFSEALKLYEEIKVYDGVAGAYNDLGEYYAQIGNQSKAMSYYFKSLEVSKKAEYQTEKASSHNNLGMIYASRNNYKQAFENYQISYSIYKKINNYEEQSRVLYNLGELEYSGNNYSRALEYYQNGLDCALKSGVLRCQKDIHEGLSKVYEKLAQPGQALMHYKSYIKAKEGIFNEENTKKLVRAELNYELELKEQQLAFENEKNLAKLKQGKIQSYFLVLSIAFLILTGWFLYQRLMMQQKLKVAKLRNKIAIDLHDEVGSSLSSISMYAGITQMNADDQVQAKMIDEIGKTSRETIENMSDIVWSIHPKNDDFKLVLEKMQHFGNHIMTAACIDFEFTYPQEVNNLHLNMEQRKNLYLIYKEGLNNAAKYSKATHVKASITKNKKNITLTIQDNGVGFDPNLIKNGNGLSNMKTRALVISGFFQVESSPSGGTCLKLEFKLG